MLYWRGLASVALIASVATVAGAQREDPLAASVRELLARGRDAPVRLIERDAVERLYGVPEPRALWTGEGRRPTRQALDAIGALASASAHGLPSDSAETRALRSLAALALASPSDAARFDVAMSRATIRRLADLHFGRIEPAAVGFAFSSAREPIDLATSALNVARAVDVAAAIAAVTPRYAGYRALEGALARYRTLAADSTLRAPRRPAASVRPGDDYDDLPVLARLLTALGDLRPGQADSVPVMTDSTRPPLYDGAIAGAIASFQRRHGLDPDSVIGQATIAQLRVPLSQRVRQIELTLERWRWLPHRPPSRYLVVNIPGFRLYGFEDDSAAEHPVFATNVIVGTADRRHHTPVFSATMREVVFRPYWDVPPRIARAELVPIFRRTPSRFDQEGFEIVRPGTSELDATTFPPTAHNLSRVAAGELRVRQRPGTANALGFIKFVFPNRYNVFLHDTPTRELFARARRDFSHGCIRVSRPNELAEFVLQGQDTWDRAAIDSMMRGARTLRVALDRPVSVFVVYATAAATSDGTVHFYPDLYKQDAALERALGIAPGTR